MTMLAFMTNKVTDQFYQRSPNTYRTLFFDNGVAIVEVFVAETTTKNGKTRAGHWRRVDPYHQTSRYRNALAHCRADLANLALRDKHPDAMILHPLFDR